MQVSTYTHSKDAYGCENMPKKDTKTKILDAALELFSERGFRGTTTKAIAELASVNEVTLFRYFESKEGIFMAMIDREADVRMEIASQDFSPSGDVEEDLAMVGSIIMKGMLNKAGLFRLLVLEIDRFPEIWEHIGTVPLQGIRMLSQYFDKAKKQGLVRTDIESEVMAMTFFSFLFRILVVNAFFGEDRFMKIDRGNAMQQFVRIFVNGIRGE